jgi:cytochrome c biogenesis protein CcmG/thiol:disulfide interchange protein DsbE
MDNNNEANLDQWANERLASLRPDSEWNPDLSRGFARLQERRGDQRGLRRRYGWAIAGIVATSLPLMALPVTRAIAQRCVSACVQESSKVREFLVGPGQAPSSTYLKTADRQMAPDFTVTDASGKQVSLSDFRGETVLLNFWATWCGPCKVEIPMLKGLHQQYRDSGFTVLGVSLDEKGWDVVKPYMKTAQFNYPVVVGGENIARLYGGMDSVPTTLIIDQSGRIAAVHVGLCNRAEYEADIDAVLKEQ